MNQNTPNPGAGENLPQNPQGSVNPDSVQNAQTPINSETAQPMNGQPTSAQNPQNFENPAQPVDGQPAYAQNPQDFQNNQQPYGQEPKKSKLGLWIGLGVLLLAIIAIVLFFIFRNNSHIDSAEDFQQKIEEVGDKGGANKCSPYSETLLAQSASEDELREELSKETNQNLDNFQVFICSNIDLTDMDALLSATSADDPQMMLGFYNPENVDWTEDGDDVNLDDSEGFNWATVGDNWALMGANPSAEEVVDIMGGEILTQK